MDSDGNKIFPQSELWPHFLVSGPKATFREHVSRRSGPSWEQACAVVGAGVGTGVAQGGVRPQHSTLMSRAAQTLFFHSEGRSNCERIRQTRDRKRAWSAPWHCPELGMELSPPVIWGTAKARPWLPAGPVGFLGVRRGAVARPQTRTEDCQGAPWGRSGGGHVPVSFSV